MTVEITPPTALDLARGDARIHPARCIRCQPRRLDEHGDLVPVRPTADDDEWTDPRPAVDLPDRVVWTHTACGNAWALPGRRVRDRAAELADA